MPFLARGSPSTDLIEMLNSAAGSLDTEVDAVDVDTATGKVFTARPEVHTGIVTATTTTILASPASGQETNARRVGVRNTHASVAQTITVRRKNGGVTVEMFKCPLAPGEKVVLNDDGTWFLYNAAGGVIMGATLASDTDPGIIEVATQAEQETATDITRAVTPGRQHFHPSAVKFWLKCGVTANLLASYNVTSLTDTGTGDVAVTIATDFSGADWCGQVSVQRTNSTAAAANARQPTIKTASQAAGSVSADCWDDTAATNVIADPTSWHITGLGDHA